MDAGHGGWLGWPANIGPAATLFSSIYQAAGSPSQVRGLATNVANYNAWSIGTCPSYTQGDSNCDEQKYINALAPLLTAAGFPAHFIVDTCELPVQIYTDIVANQASSSKWCPTYSTEPVGRLVQPQRDRLWCSTNHGHWRCTCRRVRMGQARRGMRCEPPCKLALVIQTDIVTGDFGHQCTTI